MTDAIQTLPAEPHAAARPHSLKIIGVGTAGLKVLDDLVRQGLTGIELAAIHTNGHALLSCAVPEKVLLDTQPLRGLGTGGDPERGRALAEEAYGKLKQMCDGAGVVFIIAGLGGGAGTGVAPILARAARETGALAFAFVTQPFECECSYRQRVAQQGLYELKREADGVVCLPNQKVLGIADENASVLTVFQRANVLLADAVRGVWRLLTSTGPIEIHFDKVCSLIREGAGEIAFAVAEANGANRAAAAVNLLLAHPLLDNGRVLESSGSVLLSVMGGPDLTMAEVNQVVREIRSRSEEAQIHMGTSVDPSFENRLALTLFAAPRELGEPAGPVQRARIPERAQSAPGPAGNATANPAPGTAGKADKAARGSNQRMRQAQLPLEIVASKGKFEKIPPTIHKGEDLDIPTYIRRGFALS